MEQIFVTTSVSQTEELAASLSSILHGLVALHGEMGAGKTAFVRGFVRQLLPDVRVSSPTYTVMNAYSDTLYHLDLYRVDSEDDLESVGFYDIPKNATVFCEWASRLPEDIKPDFHVYLETEGASDRRIIKVVDYADSGL